MKKVFLAVAAASFLSGCVTTATLPVKGAFQKDNEPFLGETVVDLRTHTGTMTVIAQSGRRCSGSYKMTSQTLGEGDVDCGNGQSGSFVFNASGQHGDGFGRMANGELFQFKFGDAQQEAAQWAAVADGFKNASDMIRQSTPIYTDCTKFGSSVNCKSTR